LEISITEVTPGGVERVVGVADVLPSVGGARFDDDGAGGDAEGGGVLGVVDGLAAREPSHRGGAVAAGEHQHREQPCQVKVGGERRDSQVVAAQPDPS